MSLKGLFDRAWKAAEQRSWIKGLLGKPNGDGTFALFVPDRPGFFYVRVSQEGTQSVTIAKSIGKVSARAHLPVKMRLEQGTYVIHDVDPAYYDTATATDPTNTYGVPQHTHRIGTGLEYVIEAQLLEPGRVYPATAISAFTVYINAFRYNYQGDWAYWPGGSLSLASAKPVTSSKWAWVLVGINPATNTAVAITGPEENTTTPLTVDMLDDLAVGDVIPCGAVRLATADTSVSDYSRYADARGWLHSFAPLVLAARRESNSLAQAIAANTLTVITGLTTVHLDTSGGLMAPVSPDDSIVIPRDGHYHLWASVASNDLATTEYLAARIQRNGTTNIGAAAPVWGLGSGTDIAPVAHVPMEYLDAGDTVRVRALTNRVGGATIDSAYVAIEYVEGI